MVVDNASLAASCVAALATVYKTIVIEKNYRYPSRALAYATCTFLELFFVFRILRIRVILHDRDMGLLLNLAHVCVQGSIVLQVSPELTVLWFVVVAPLDDKSKRRFLLPVACMAEHFFHVEFPLMILQGHLFGIYSIRVKAIWSEVEDKLLNLLIRD